MPTNEIWKDVVGYEGLYQVSNLGRVKSLPKYHYKYEKILHPTVRKKDGRVTVMLSKSPVDRKRFSVHRLVAIAFLDNPYNYPEINHIDENPQNNCVNNLEWCTRKYNMNYGTTPKRLNLKNMKSVEYYEDGHVVRFNSIRGAKKYGFDSAGILRSIKLGIKYKGKEWKYADKQQS